MATNRGPELAAVLGIFLGLAWLFVSLRITVKLFLSRSWGADDSVLLISLIFFTTYASCSLSGVVYGTGRHVDDIPLQDMSKALYYWFLCELFYTTTTVLVRLSVAIFLLRICITPVHRYIVYGTMISIILFSIAYFFMILFQCHPVSFFWNQYNGMQGSCIGYWIVPDASIAHSAISATCDWILGLLPLALIWHLQVNKRTKFSIGVVLALGILAGVATLIRVPYIRVLTITDDFLFATTDVAIWSTIEAGLGIIAFAAAPLRPLFRRFYALSTRSNNQAHHKEDVAPFSRSHHHGQSNQLQSYTTEHSHKSSQTSTTTPTSPVHHESPVSRTSTEAQGQEPTRLRNDVVVQAGEVTVSSLGNSHSHHQRHHHRNQFSSSRHQRRFIGLGDMDQEWAAEGGIQLQRTVDVRAGTAKAEANPKERGNSGKLFSSSWTQRGALGTGDVSERGRGSVEDVREGGLV